MNFRTIVRRGNYVAAALAVVIVIVTLLGGCTRTVTVTGKFRSIVGWYYVCTGARPLPCTKTTEWHVTKARYDQARIGQSYTIRVP